MPDTPTTDDAPKADTAGDRPEPSLDEIKSVLAELGLTPGQVKGRLEASRKWEDRAREKEPFIEELKAKAKKLEDIENANKSELEKAQARADAAEKKALQTELSALRASVALDRGLTPSQAKRLVGSTQEELEADAEELLADLKNSKPAAAPSSDGQGKQGEPVGNGVKQLNKADLDRMAAAGDTDGIENARAAGQFNDLLQIK